MSFGENREIVNGSLENIVACVYIKANNGCFYWYTFQYYGSDFAQLSLNATDGKLWISLRKIEICCNAMHELSRDLGATTEMHVHSSTSKTGKISFHLKKSIRLKRFLQNFQFCGLILIQLWFFSQSKLADKQCDNSFLLGNTPTEIGVSSSVVAVK